jgi:hypothetical protein
MLACASTMSTGKRALNGVLIAAFLMGTVMPSSGFAAGGIPNFAPDDSTGWVPARGAGDEFMPPPSGPGPVQAEAGHPYVPNREGQPTYRIADVNSPILMPWVAERLKKANDEVRAGKVPYIPHERCWPGGVPGWEVYTRVRPIYFVQAAKEVTIIDELDHQLRHVYMDVPHSANPKPSWYGESVGHYEGEELVVDTIGENDKSLVDNYQTPHTDKIHVVERYKLIEGGKVLQVTVTVDDAGAFTMPWSAVQQYRRGPTRPMQELACAENNFDFLGYQVVPIPQADKPDF